MAYVAVKGGERAIDNAHAWLAEERRGDPAVPELVAGADREQLGRAVDRVMAEGSLYDRELAALAIKQAQGDLIEAAFLLRAYRTTLPRFAHSRAGGYRRDADAARASRRCSRICRAARCSARPTTTRIGCWISRWPTTAAPPPAPQRRAGRCGDAARAGHPRP